MFNSSVTRLKRVPWILTELNFSKRPQSGGRIVKEESDIPEWLRTHRNGIPYASSQLVTSSAKTTHLVTEPSSVGNPIRAGKFTFVNLRCSLSRYLLTDMVLISERKSAVLRGR